MFRPKRPKTLTCRSRVTRVTRLYEHFSGANSKSILKIKNFFERVMVVFVVLLLYNIIKRVVFIRV